MPTHSPGKRTADPLESTPMTIRKTIAIIGPSVDQLQATPVASSKTVAIINPQYNPSVDPLQATPACGLK